MKTLLFVETTGIPIYRQLQIEEALLRAGRENICLVNFGSPPAIVLGISGKIDELVAPHSPLPLVRRFSGGGTVVVDENTLFVSLIMNHSDLPVSPFPKPVLHYAGSLLAPFFPPSFSIRENDFALGEKKIGGNAQYFSKDRWVHHTTFLWDYDSQKMSYLKHPPKEPAYRQKRPHSDFLAPLKAHFPSPQAIASGLRSSLEQSFLLKNETLASLEKATHLPHRRSTTQIL